MQRSTSMTPLHALMLVPVSLLFAGPIGGFIYGWQNCDGCEGHLFMRIFIGCVHAVLVPLQFGFPWSDEAGVGPRGNAWPQISLSAAAVYLVLFVFLRRFGTSSSRG